MGKQFRVGEIVVYSKQKTGTSPGPRAKSLHGSKKGDDYTYIVDKFWRVASAEGDQLILKTRRGKSHVICADDNRLRRPSFWENLFMRAKFPSLEDEQAGVSQNTHEPTSAAS